MARKILFVEDTLAFDGTILAHGTASLENCAHGGGSGGSVWILAGNVTTTITPVIAANGGNGTPDSGAGCGCVGIGAGGRGDTIGRKEPAVQRPSVELDCRP